MTGRRKGRNNITEVKKASKNGNKKEEKIKLEIMHSCSYRNMKVKKKKKEAQTEEGHETAQSQRKDEEAEHSGQDSHSQEATGMPGGVLRKEAMGNHLDTKRGGGERHGAQMRERSELRKEHMWQCAFSTFGFS